MQRFPYLGKVVFIDVLKLRFIRWGGKPGLFSDTKCKNRSYERGRRRSEAHLGEESDLKMESRVGSDAVMSQGVLAATWGQKGQRRTAVQSLQKDHSPAIHLEFRLLAVKTVTEWACVVWNHSVATASFWIQVVSDLHILDLLLTVTSLCQSNSKAALQLCSSNWFYH